MEKRSVSIYWPKWFTRKFLLAVLLVAAAGTGCYFWGMSSDTAYYDRLATEPSEALKGREAGFYVSAVGSTNITQGWTTFCNNVIADAKSILREQ